VKTRAHIECAWPLGLGENGISRVDEWLQQQQIPLALNSHKVTAGFCSTAARIQARPV
jgi:hypothetical protein